MPTTVDRKALNDFREELGELVLDPSRLLGTMERLARAARAEGAVLLQSEIRTPDVPRTASIDGMITQYFKEGWHVRDRRLGAIPKMLATGIGVDQDFATPEMFKRDPYYIDLMRPHGLQWWAGIRIAVEGSIWCMALQRTPRQGAFELADERMLAKLCPALSQSAELSLLLTRAKIDAASTVLDLIGEAALLMDRFGRISHFNAAAEALFNDDFQVVAKSVRCQDPAATVAIAELALQVREAQPRIDTTFAPIVLRRQRRGPLIIKTISLPPNLADTFIGARAFLIVRENVAAQSEATPALRETFGLTIAETALATALLAGLSLAEYAQKAGVTRNTARNQLAAVFAKTGTNRQGELVALLAHAALAGR